jgi:hypothetical protein
MQGLMQALSWLAIAASLATSYGHGRWHYLAHRYQPGNARPHITMFAFLGFIGTVMALVWLAMFVWQGPGGCCRCPSPSPSSSTGPRSGSDRRACSSWASRA